MRVLLLHSDVPPGAPPDEIDTLETVEAVAAALDRRGHCVGKAAFAPDPAALAAAISAARAEVVFNLVESVWGHGELAAWAPAMLANQAIPFTGAGAAAIVAATDKIFSKQLLALAGLPTAAWVQPPSWQGLEAGTRYVVKSVTEDASLGLDDGAVVSGENVEARARLSCERHGGRWFAEAYLEGREFNVSLLEAAGEVRVLPVAEMCFESWPVHRPRLVGYEAKWNDASDDARHTVRKFGLERHEPALARRLAGIARAAWTLFRLKGYARIDFRLDLSGAPMVLEANPNPCLEPHAGFAAAAAQADIAYTDLVEQILRAANCY
jgi:D-alanine-D-alanine ligase